MSPNQMALKAAAEAAGITNNPRAVYDLAAKMGFDGATVDGAFGLEGGQFLTGKLGTSDAWVKAQGLDPLVQRSAGAPAVSGPVALPGGTNNLQRGYTGVGPADPASPEVTGGYAGSGPQRGNPYMGQQGNYVPGNSNFSGGMGAGTAPQGRGANPYLQGQQSAGASNPFLGSNPALPWMADNIGQRLGQNLQRNILPGIRSAASLAGGLGGSRQGIAEGIAIGDTMTGYGNTLANLYGNQYNQDRSYGLQNDALDLNVWQANQNAMRQGQQDQIGFGGQMLDMNQRYGVGNATQAQNTPMQNWQQFSNGAAQLGGMGGTQSQNMQGNPYLTAAGGAMTAYDLYNKWNKQP